MKRGDQQGDQVLNRVVELHREQAVVREERDHESVDEKDPGVNRKGLEDQLSAANTSHRFLVGTLKDIRQGGVSADLNTEVGGGVTQRKRWLVLAALS